MIFDHLKQKRNHETSEPENARKKGRRILSLLQREKQEPTREITDNNAEIQKRKEFITDHVNITALFSSIFTALEDETGKYISALKNINALLSPSENLHDTNNLLQDFPSTIELLENKGLVSKEKIEAPRAEKLLEDITGETKSWIKDTFTVTHLVSYARKNNLIPQLESFEDSVHSLLPTLQSLGEYDLNTRTHTLHPLISGGLQNSLYQNENYIDEKDKDFTEEQVKNMPNTLYLSGLDNLQEPLGIDNPREWVNQQLELIPSWARVGLGSLTFRSTPINPKGYVKTEKVNKGVGRLLPAENKIEIYSLISMRQAHIKNSVSPQQSFNALRSTVQQKLLHELAHHMHRHHLPLKDLREWLEVAQEEQSPVSDYSEHAKNTRTPSDPTGLSEDLAESVSFYYTDAQNFVKSHPERFLLLQEWFNEYSDKAVQTIFNPSTAKITREVALDSLLPREKHESIKEFLRNHQT